MARVDSLSVRYDWYQTDIFVVVTVLLRNLKASDVDVRFTERTVSFSARLLESKEYNLLLNLACEIVPSESTWKQYPSKVEMKLKKADGFRWTSLESTATDPAPASAAAAKELARDYPSSSSQKRNWDKIVTDISKAEEEEEKNAQGDEAVGKLFQKIYSEGSEEVRRAMNKSFMESGGTTLSTNWQEVSKDTVTVKPPEGMEFKKWDI